MDSLPIPADPSRCPKGRPRRCSNTVQGLSAALHSCIRSAPERPRMSRGPHTKRGIMEQNETLLGESLPEPASQEPFDQRQLLLPVDDNYSCRSSGVTIWYRRYRIGHRSAGNGTEAEANGRQESASVGRSIGDERADVTDVAARQAAIGEEGQETVANSTGPVRRGMGRGGRAPSAERR